MGGVVTLLSGGMDSATLLWYLKSMGYSPVHAVLFDYGQRHRKELSYAAQLAQMAGVAHSVANLQSFGALLPGNSQTDKLVEVPEGHYTATSMEKTVVPNRNMVMLSIAAGIAQSRGIYTLAFGAHAGDHAIYPDCRKPFVEALETALQLGTDKTFKVLSPFIRSSKTEIALMGATLGVPFEHTWSCYKGRTLHCGRCGTCVERIEAFRDSGVPDPTQYEV